jgi:hypothetical protein
MCMYGRFTLRVTLINDLQSEEPNGVVNLKGAIVMESKRIPLAFEIHTGGLYSERGVEKRTYIFTPEGAGTRARFQYCFHASSLSLCCVRSSRIFKCNLFVYNNLVFVLILGIVLADESKASDRTTDREKERLKLRILRDNWMSYIEREAAKAFLPGQ